MGSPSESTIYVPALNQTTIEGQEHMIDKISNFVEEVRIETGWRHSQGATPQQSPGRIREAKQGDPAPSAQVQPGTSGLQRQDAITPARE